MSDPSPPDADPRDKLAVVDQVLLPVDAVSPDLAEGDALELIARDANPDGRVPEGQADSVSFWLLIATQLFTAINDNLFRWFIVPLSATVMAKASALSLGGVCFLLPYLLLAPLSGSLADRYPKRSVTLACKVAEILIILFGIGMIWAGSAAGVFVAVTLMGAQSAVFAPAKYAAIPEYLPPSWLPRGNGLMGVATVLGTAVGTVGGYMLFEAAGISLELQPTLERVALIASPFLAISALGLAASVYMREVAAADPERRIDVNPLTATIPALKHVTADQVILRTALGIAFFWSLGSLAQLAVDPFGIEVLHLTGDKIGVLMATLVVGVGFGSFLAGLLCGDTIELGLVPLGALGIAGGAFMVYFAGAIASGTSSPENWAWVACVGLGVLGISSGLFDIPLEAYLQHRAPNRTRGTILAGVNFITFAGMVGACVFFYLVKGLIGLDADSVFLLAGLGTLPVMIYALTLLPKATTRLVAWLLSHTAYRTNKAGVENLPETGGVLLVSNHISWADGPLITAVCPRPVRFLIWSGHVERFGFRTLSAKLGLIPINPAGPRRLIKSLDRARQALEQGEVVCIFAEGEISRTGQLLPFQGGISRLVRGLDHVPVIPVYLAGLWGSVFSFQGGKFFWKMPRRFPYPVTVHMGRPLPVEARRPAQVRRAVERLGSQAMTDHHEPEAMFLPRFLRTCKAARFRSKIADSTGVELSGVKLLAGVLAFRRVFEREPWAEQERVGVLLPPTVGAAVANVTLALRGQVTINLNYTLDEETLNACIAKAGVKTVITSRKFLEKKPYEMNAEVVFLEDLKEKVTSADKAAAAVGAYATPTPILSRQLGLHLRSGDDLLTIVFTSGSTGLPKGVCLTYANVYSQLSAVDHLFHLDSSDVEMGVLPFFHSFGYSETLWLPLCSAPKVVYHVNPLDSRTVGELCDQHGVTFLFATPTFLRSYHRRITSEQMHRLDLVVVGAEKMPADMSDKFEEKFRVRPTEGYGATELSPFTAVNVPDHRSTDVHQLGTKEGSVGRVMPGSTAKIVDPDTGEELEFNTEGLLMIHGPNVMSGYLDDPEETAAVVRDGWYDTGDLAVIDEDGFITITGRRSRFSKIGGEMVPHIRVEQTLERLCDQAGDEEDEPVLAVSSVPDERKGERLIVLHRPLPMSVADLLEQAAEEGLSNLWLPSSDDFHEVDHIPLLGSGKLDLKRLAELANERANPVAA